MFLHQSIRMENETQRKKMIEKTRRMIKMITLLYIGMSDFLYVMTTTFLALSQALLSLREETLRSNVNCW